MSYIKLSDLTIGYEGRSVAEHINMEIGRGDYLCIVGENGAGKSTLMKTMLHLNKEIAGQILYGDGLKPYEIGYLPQQTVVQKDFPASVWEIALSGNLSKCGFRPYYSSEEKARTKENLEKMGIWNLRRKSYRNLSGGQQQRVLLARALCASSKVLFLDEPVSGLDPKATAELYQVLRELNREGMTMIMVSHDIQAAFAYASHILHIGKEKVFFGTREEYENSELGRGFREAKEEMDEWEK